MSNTNRNGGGGWRHTEATSLASVCDLSQEYRTFVQCFNSNTYGANDTLLEIKIKQRNISLDKPLSEVFEFFGAKVSMINFSLTKNNEDFTFYLNPEENRENYVR